jgi:hypothetical protein
MKKSLLVFASLYFSLSLFAQQNNFNNELSTFSSKALLNKIKQQNAEKGFVIIMEIKTEKVSTKSGIKYLKGKYVQDNSFLQVPFNPGGLLLPISLSALIDKTTINTQIFDSVKYLITEAKINKVDYSQDFFEKGQYLTFYKDENDEYGLFNSMGNKEEYSYGKIYGLKVKKIEEDECPAETFNFRWLYHNSYDNDYLSVRISDYADWDLTKKYINEMFPDYI